MIPTMLAALALSAPVPKDLPTELKWKFNKGDVFYLTWEDESTGAPTSSATAFLFKLSVPAADEKETKLEAEFVSYKSGTATDGKEIKMADETKVVGKKVTFTLDATQAITKTDNSDLGVAAVGNLREETLASMMDFLLRAVPGKKLGKGEVWVGEQEKILTSGISYKRADRGTVGDTEKGLTKLEVESDYSWNGKEVGLAVNLKAEKGKRTVLFEGKSGRVRKVQEEYTVTGTVSGGGQTRELTGLCKTTVTVTDDKPKGEK